MTNRIAKLTGTSLRFLVGGCSLPLVTTYGNAPRELSPGRYEFSLYYNADATDEHIDRKARQIVEELRASHAFENCEFNRQPMVPSWRNKELRVFVFCN